MIRSERYKHVFYTGHEENGELYDLQTDPHELDNFVPPGRANCSIFNVKNGRFECKQNDREGIRQVSRECIRIVQIVSISILVFLGASEIIICRLSDGERIAAIDPVYCRMDLDYRLTGDNWPFLATLIFTCMIYMIDTEFGQTAQLTSGSSVDRFPQWSPSGQYAAFVRQNPDEHVEEPPVFCHEMYRITSLDGRTILVHRVIPPNAREMGLLDVIGGPEGEYGRADV